jgi:DNA-binding transcriptional MerR regulator
MTMIEIESIETDPLEMTLADQHVPVKPEDLPPVEQILSLPAALCDEKLLEEINSIPNKMGFKIGEVADLLGIKQYVLRYWESEFEILKPKKAANNQRYYTKKDVENAYLIRKLLHRDRFSIEGARAALRDLKSFVRSEVRKEKTISSMTQKFDHLNDMVDDLLIQIRRVKQLF